MEKLRVCTLCSGYDSQMMALRRCPYVDADLVYWSEIDKNAIKAHNAVFPEYKDRNLGDMTKIDWSTKEDFDLLTYSTPCTSLSNAGKQEGMVKDSGTESSIIWSVENCIKEKRPKYLLFENVKNIITKKFIDDFNSWCKLLESYGYTNYYQVMNSKDHNVAQNRERLYMISIHGEHEKFKFPEKEELVQTLSDIMDEKTNEKHYVKQEYLENFIKNESQSLFPNEALKKTYGIGALRTRSIGEWYSTPHFQNFEFRSAKYSNALTSVTKDNILLEKEGNNYRARRLSDREVFKLMDVSSEDIDKIQSYPLFVPKGLSYTEWNDSLTVDDRKLLKKEGIKNQYKLAGNSIVVRCLEKIFNNLFS